jgi:hypothetical protein
MPVREINNAKYQEKYVIKITVLVKQDILKNHTYAPYIIFSSHTPRSYIYIYIYIYTDPFLVATTHN